MVSIRKRSVSHEFALRAKENLRVLRAQKEIAKEIIDYAHKRLALGVRCGEISKTTSETIASRLCHDQNSIDREYDQYNKIIQLHALEASQVSLFQEFNSKVTELNDELAIVRRALRDYLCDATTDNHSSPLERIDPPLTEPLSVSHFQPKYASKFLLFFLVIIPLMLFLPYSFGLLSTQQVTNSSGVVASVDLVVYQDTEGTRILETLDWGTIFPGQDLTQVIYVMNNGNVNMTLHFETANWNPSTASGHISMNWDLPSDNLISPGTIAPIQISLSVSNDIQNIQAFTFNILLTGNPVM